MAWRRPLLTLLLVLLAVSFVSVPGRRSSDSSPTAARAGQPVPPAFHVTLPADGRVRVPQGRLVELRVTSLEPDIARIDALGLHAPVGPDLDGPTFRFPADPIGRYTVHLDIAGTSAGTIEVTAPKGG